MATHDERLAVKAFADMLRKHIPRGERDALAGQIGEVTGKAIGHWLTGRSLPARRHLEAVITHQRVPDGESAALRRAWADCHVDVADVFREDIARSEALADGWRAYGEHFRSAANVGGVTERERALLATLRTANLDENDVPDELMDLLSILRFGDDEGPGAALLAAARAARERDLRTNTLDAQTALVSAIGAVARALTAVAG